MILASKPTEVPDFAHTCVFVLVFTFIAIERMVFDKTLFHLTFNFVGAYFEIINLSCMQSFRQKIEGKQNHFQKGI
jgi:hypothetical protein